MVFKLNRCHRVPSMVHYCEQEQHYLIQVLKTAIVFKAGFSASKVRSSLLWPEHLILKDWLLNAWINILIVLTTTILCRTLPFPILPVNQLKFWLMYILIIDTKKPLWTFYRKKLKIGKLEGKKTGPVLSLCLKILRTQKSRK